MVISEMKNDAIMTVKDVLLKDVDICRRLSEIGVKKGSKLRFIKKSKISGCVLVEILGSVFMIDEYVARGIECYE